MIQSRIALVGLVSIVLTACGDSVPTTTAAPTPAANVDAAETTYVCPMHPKVTSTKANAKCTECGMDLVKKDEKPPASNHAGHAH